MTNTNKEQEWRAEFYKHIGYDLYYVGKARKIKVGLDDMVTWWLSKLSQQRAEIAEAVHKLRGEPSSRDNFDYDLGQVDAYKKVLSLLNPKQ